MTTKQQPTPYDAEIERLTSVWGLKPDQRMALSGIRLQREGYLRAKAEDAELLAACRVGLEASSLRQSDHECHNDACQDAERSRFIRAAIAKYEGVTP